MHRTAGIVIIGNEILSGKVADSNSHFMARELRSVGVDLRRVTVIPDELDEIAGVVRDFHERFDYVFTSGGVGPTHDDITVAGVARAFGRSVVRHPALEERLRGFYKGEINEAQLKMAEVPEGSELIFGGSIPFPTFKIENVYLLPGIPEILESKFAKIRERFAVDPYHLRVVYTKVGEGTLAAWLHETLEKFPDLLLGSYPKLGHPDYRVKLTLESKDPEYVDRAFRHLMRLLPEDSVVKVEEG